MRVKYVKVDGQGRIVSVSTSPVELPEDVAAERGLVRLEDSGTTVAPMFRLYDPKTRTAGELRAVAPSADK